MVESKAIEVLRSDIEKYEKMRSEGKKCLCTCNKEKCIVSYPEIKEALLVLEQKEILLSKAKSRIEILDKEKVEFLDNTKGREIYTTMNRQERAIWEEVRKVLGK